MEPGVSARVGAKAVSPKLTLCCFLCWGPGQSPVLGDEPVCFVARGRHCLGSDPSLPLPGERIWRQWDLFVHVVSHSWVASVDDLGVIEPKVEREGKGREGT